MSLPPFNSIKLLLCLALAAFLVACSDSSGNDNANANISNQEVLSVNPNSVKDNTEELESIIKLPETPDEAVWREEETTDPKGKKLTAVLKYTSEAAAKIVDSSTKNGAVEIGAESWFPDELTAQAQLSGNESIKATAYGANNFYNQQYIKGRLARVNDTNYFVLELTTY